MTRRTMTPAEQARRLAELGQVDRARRVISGAPPGVVVIEVNETVPPSPKLDPNRSGP